MEFDLVLLDFLKRNMLYVLNEYKVKEMLVALLYLALAGTYLLVMPVFILLYLNFRWYVASSLERAFMYFLVFFFFPGLLLLSPIVNLRPRRRKIVV